MKIKKLIMACGKEAFGVFILILLGIGVMANVALAPQLNPGAYGWNTVAFGWGFAYVVAFFISGGVATAHLNPAVTLALAIRRNFPWKKVIYFISAQMIGAFLGAAGVWFMYKDGLAPAGFPNIWATSPGTTYDGAFWGAAGADPVSRYRVVVACVAELFGTLIFIWAVLALRGANKTHQNKYLSSIVIGVTVSVIGLSLGGPSGFAINPARDLPPRILGTIMGTKGLFSGLYWFLSPFLIPLLSGPLAVVLYDLILPGNSTEDLSE